MRAVICESYGPASTLAVKEVDDLVPGKGQVRIAVEACGVNFPDTLIIQGKYQFKPAPPFAPGGEVSGVIDMLGEGVTRARLGDRVMAMSLYGGFAEGLGRTYLVFYPAQICRFDAGIISVY